MEFLNEYGLFLAKAVTFVIAILIIAGAMVPLARREQTARDKGSLHVTRVNDRFRDLKRAICETALEGKALKEARQQRKQAEKAHKQQMQSCEQAPARLFVINFKGDIKASAVQSLRQEVSAILTMVRDGDEVLAIIDSPGGAVHGYGLAASQLDRLRKRGVTLVTAIDKVAASGGYMMACVGQRIIAAPFAIVGSIGVIGQLPNFNRLLKKHDIDFEMHTAGEYKRTLTLFGENSDEGRRKFSEDLESIHRLFKQFVAEHRADLDIDRVATGEIWLAREAIDLKLVDELATSDEYILDRIGTMDVLEVRFEPRKTLPEKFGRTTEGVVDNLLLRWWQRLRENRFFS